MQLIGARVIVLCPSASYGLQWKSGYLRAASEPVLELVHLLRPDMQVRGGGRKGKGGGESRGVCGRYSAYTSGCSLPSQVEAWSLFC